MLLPRQQPVAQLVPLQLLLVAVALRDAPHAHAAVVLTEEPRGRDASVKPTELLKMAARSAAQQRLGHLRRSRCVGVGVGAGARQRCRGACSRAG